MLTVMVTRLAEESLLQTGTSYGRKWNNSRFNFFKIYQKVANRTWQGMKHRYLQVLKPRLENNTSSKVPLVTVTPVVPTPTTPQYQHSSEEFDIDDEEEGEEQEQAEEEEEEEEEVEDRREEPRRSPIPKRLSTNGVQKRQLERGAVRKLVSDLSLHFNVAQSVVYHALIIHSGDIELAEQYLESYGGIYSRHLSQVVIDTKPWNPVEDALLMSANPSTQRLESIIEKRGREETLARIEWLDS